MNRYLLLLAFCASCFVVGAAELSEDELEKLQDSVKISAVSDDTVRGDDGEKSEVIKFRTLQREDDEYKFRVQVVAELTDKKKNTYYTQMARLQGETDMEYTGESGWKFILPQGTLEKPKLTAFVIQYGILQDDGEFLVLAEEMDDVDTKEELIERAKNLLEQKAYIEHQYSYRDSNEEVVESLWSMD